MDNEVWFFRSRTINIESTFWYFYSSLLLIRSWNITFLNIIIYLFASIHSSYLFLVIFLSLRKINDWNRWLMKRRIIIDSTAGITTSWVVTVLKLRLLLLLRLNLVRWSLRTFIDKSFVFNSWCHLDIWFWSWLLWQIEKFVSNVRVSSGWLICAISTNINLSCFYTEFTSVHFRCLRWLNCCGLLSNFLNVLLHSAIK